MALSVQQAEAWFIRRNGLREQCGSHAISALLLVTGQASGSVPVPVLALLLTSPGRSRINSRVQRGGGCGSLPFCNWRLDRASARAEAPQYFEQSKYHRNRAFLSLAVFFFGLSNPSEYPRITRLATRVSKRPSFPFFPQGKGRKKTRITQEKHDRDPPGILQLPIAAQRNTCGPRVDLIHVSVLNRHRSHNILSDPNQPEAARSCEHNGS